MLRQLLHRSLSLGVAILASSAIGPLLSAAEPVLLRYQFQPGQIVRYEVVLNDDYHIELADGIDNPYSHQNSTKSYEVKSVQEDGSAVLSLTIESIQLEIVQNGEKTKFDSTKKVEGPLPPEFLSLNGMVGKPHLEIVVSPTGEISSSKPIGGNIQPESNAGPSSFDVLMGLPEKPVAVGESWKEDVTVNVGLTANPALQKPVKIQRVFTLKSYEDSVAVIDVQTRVLTVLDDASEELQLLRRKPKGTVVIDNKQGVMRSKSLTQKNEVTGFDSSASLFKFTQKQEETMILNSLQK
jgi:hypothetical protein